LAVDVQRKNLDAFTKSARIASTGAQSLVTKQRETVEFAFRETLNLVREAKPIATPQEISCQATELAQGVRRCDQQYLRYSETRQTIDVDALKLIERRIKGSIQKFAKASRKDVAKEAKALSTATKRR
jgi:hypothetical protein